jgi:hypothetical protein
MGRIAGKRPLRPETLMVILSRLYTRPSPEENEKVRGARRSSVAMARITLDMNSSHASS